MKKKEESINAPQFTIDDGGHGEDNSVLVIDDWVHRLVADDMEIWLQMTLKLGMRRDGRAKKS